MKWLDKVPHGGRILVIRLRSLGDCVLTTPALRILAAARPDCRIGVAVEDRFRELFAGNPDVARILPPSPAAVTGFGAHLCLNLHGGTRSMWLTAASVARCRAGFAHHSGAWSYTVRIPRAQEILGEDRTVHTAEHLASAIFHLGAPRMEIPRARLFAAPPAPRAPYAVIHPFASQPDKTWPAPRFAALARHVQMELRLEPVFVGAASDDFSPFAGFAAARGKPLEEVKSLLSGASLFLGNDSGPAHMAAAFGLPVLVLFGSSDPVVWAPWRTAAETIAGALGDVPVADAVAALDRLKVRA